MAAHVLLVIILRERGDGAGKPLGMKKTRLRDENTLGIEVEKTFIGLRRHFLFAPFSVLRASDGEWQKRKRMWLALGVKSEVGRGGKRESAHLRIKTNCTNCRERE